MTDDRTPVDQALDLLVYAPIGLALSARDLIPKLAERGREQWTNQVGVARLIGRFAVKQGTAEAEKALARAREQAMARLNDLGLLNDADPASPGPPATDDGGGAVARPDTESEASAATSFSARPAAAPVGPAPDLSEDAASAPTSAPGGPPTATDLAIPDYDSLSASQVVPRLSGLIPAELEVVRAYEAAHRARTTILNKITQLEAP